MTFVNEESRRLNSRARDGYVNMDYTVHVRATNSREKRYICITISFE